MNICRNIQACVFTLAVIAVSFANAQSIAEISKNVSGEDFVAAFLGHCAQNPGNIDRVKAAAKSLGYPFLPEEWEPLVAPQDPNADFTGYFVFERQGAPYVLGVSRSLDNDRILETCVVANPSIDTMEVVLALQKFAQLNSPSEDQSIAGQRYRIWFTDDIATGSFVSLIDAEPMGLGGATLGITATAIE